MEQYIERAGGPLPALRQIIETDIGHLLHRSLPHINAAPHRERAAVLQTVTDTLDEFFHCIAYKLYQAHHALSDTPAQRRYLSEYQHTVLELLGHLLRYTQPAQLHSRHAPRNFKDACCHHLYRALDSLLEYTLRLDGGQPDPGLPLPPTARTLLQEMIVGDLVALRQHLEQLHVSPGLIDITLAPFEALPQDYSVTFYQVHYLRTLKQALLQPPLPGYDPTGDGRVCWALVAQNFNAPAFIAYCQGLAEARLKTCPSPEAWRRELHHCKTRLATYPCSSPLAWHPGHPGVREQLIGWLDAQLAAPADASDPAHAVTFASSGIRASGNEVIAEKENDTAGPYPSNRFMLQVPPKILAVIANAARILRYILWGEDGKHIAEMVARIPSVHGPQNSDTLRRGLNELATIRQARDLLQKIIDFLDEQIKAKEEKLFR